MSLYFMALSLVIFVKMICTETARTGWLMVAVRSGGGTEEDGYNLIVLVQGKEAEDPHQYARVTLAECRQSCRVKILILSVFDQF